ncbi:MAG: sn-glycerol-3-phosphate ABC transporter substrate-binding protein UgpB [Azospirillaceae bacterium]
MRIRFAFAASALAITVAAPAMAQDRVQIDWWHAMGGALGEKVDEIAAGFNASQDQYEVLPTYQGSYADTMNAAIAAFRAGEQPDIVQVFEVGTATMMSAEGAIYPVYQLMEDTGTPFDPADYLPAVTGYYTTPEGQMLSMPFNSSTPVMYYNREIFAEAGLDPDSPPETWPEFFDAMRTIVESGAADCGFTTTWQSWIQVENFSAWHNVPIGTQENGFAGVDTELTINNPAVVAHIQNLGDLAAEGIFQYGGRQSDSGALFDSATCAVTFASSAGYAGFVANSTFDFGIGMLPYYPDLAEGPNGGPQNSIIGGATLWVLSGATDEEYAGVAQFFSYLSSPEVQYDWHQFTGYLPITLAAYELAQEEGLYEERPGFDTAINQINLNPPTANSKGLRFGYMVQIRDIINAQLENVWAGNATAQEALDAAVEQSNELLRQFEEDVSG